MLLLFTALVTAQLADGARRGAETAREAAVARRSDELKTALLRAVTHNLRTPLASIKASVSGLRQPDAAFADEDRAELLAEIEEEADRLDRLVTNLLDASRLEAGGVTLSSPSAGPGRADRRGGRPPAAAARRAVSVRSRFPKSCRRWRATTPRSTRW